MILRASLVLLTAIAIACSLGSAVAAGPKTAASPPTQKPRETVAAPSQPAAKPKAKPRRVIILGTTIVGDVLTPPIERTVPWQRPAAFRSNAAPLTHDFTAELLTPLDRNAILRQAGERGH
jgi:hypothetical protein